MSRLDNEMSSSEREFLSPMTVCMISAINVAVDLPAFAFKHAKRSFRPSTARIVDVTYPARTITRSVRMEKNAIC